MFATGQSVRPEPRRGRTEFCRPVRSFLELALLILVKDRAPPSPTVPCRPLQSPTRICLRSWGLSSFLMTAALEIQGRGRTAFCRPVQSFSLVARQVGMKDEGGLRFAVWGSWHSPRRALRGPRTAANTARTWVRIPCLL